MSSTRTLLAWIGATSAGALFALSVYRVERFHHLTARDGVLAAMMVLFPASFYLARKAEYLSLLTGLFMLFGVAVGVTLDAVLDRSVDRNLFPLEIVVLAVITAPAIVAGTVAGSWRRA
jgi:hypothetical protein